MRQDRRRGHPPQRIHARAAAFLRGACRTEQRRKTTLVRAVLNLVASWSDDICIAGQRTTRTRPFIQARNGIGYMPEDRRLAADWTVEQNTMLPAWATRTRDLRSRLE
jgi:ABC-type branched-subunit amino acid transport system ATPase component